MSVLFGVQAVVLVIGGYLIGVGFFRKRWSVTMHRRERCENPVRWAVARALPQGRDPLSIGTHPMVCEGPHAAVEESYARLFDTRFCAECVEYAEKVHASASEKDKAWAWPIVGIGKALMAVVRIGESFADMETKP